MLVGIIIAAILSGGCLAGVFLFFRKSMGGAVGSERQDTITAIENTTSQLNEIIQFSDSYASKGQLESVVNQLEEVKVAVETQKSTLKEIERKLDTAQKQVEEKETHQQDLKTVKEEDEKKLQELLEQYEATSSESISLEQKLALSLKNLDTMMGEIGGNPEHKAILEELSNALTNSGSRLRDLITEYEVVHERLESLQVQFKDLEEEYTRLVEQQLGE